MGIFDFMRNFQERRDKAKRADNAILAVRNAAQQADYNQASIEAFYAVEILGEVYRNVNRTEATTAREYAKMLEEEGVISESQLEPLVLNFELAKYSQIPITFDQYSEAEKLLDSFHLSVKSSKKPKGKPKGKAGAKGKRQASSRGKRKRPSGSSSSSAGGKKPARKKKKRSAK